MTRVLLGLTTAAILAITLSACSAGADGGKLDPAKSPLTEYYDALYGGFDQEDWAAQQVKVEEMVAACMSDEGFEYIPVDQSQGMTTSTGEEWKPDDEEWVAQYGYGFVNSPGREAAIEPGNEFVDPNQDYVMSLSESEQSAYYETLYGPSPTEEELGEDGSYEYNWETAGCQGAAQHEVQGDNPYDDEKNKPLFDAMNALYDKAQKDPKVAGLNADWASCMADAGYSGFESKQDAQNKFIDELNAFYESKTEGVQDDDPDLKALGEREIEIALADLGCAKKLDYTQQTLKVQFELEKQFIADHKAELDALVAESQQGK